MINTAVIVGEISATDWAKSVGKPNALVRSPKWWMFGDWVVGAEERVGSWLLAFLVRLDRVGGGRSCCPLRQGGQWGNGQWGNGQWGNGQWGNDWSSRRRSS